MPKNNHKALIKIYITQNSAIVPERLPHRLSTTLCFELLGNASFLQILHSCQNFLLQFLAVVDVTFCCSQRLCDVIVSSLPLVITLALFAFLSTCIIFPRPWIPKKAFFLAFKELSEKSANVLEIIAFY